ncbi:hypothetical protein Mag101_07330 [Microbulbifer agarilyticus]|uniref:HTH cro/C1-type domain-containing protein n=1 Tax=Microbulbifer agarilyticus TaxID=260552 RepID=A0A1Q2M486_9GAMM|nr:hypothetical protein [Microbulbifer agarilyticus]AQQ67470.1 hypothetical protein Mag101_07330 [Microbulbifer agarilyticus]
MEIKDVRKKNLNLLADEHGRAEIAERLGYPDTNYLNQLCGGHTDMGSRTARKVEERFQLPRGWMDYPQQAESIHEAAASKAAAPLPQEVVSLLALIEETARDGVLTAEYAQLLEQQIRMMTTK